MSQKKVWKIIAESDGSQLGIVWAITKDEADELAKILLAETGADRELGYEGYQLCRK
jgi:hypothetical protein